MTCELKTFELALNMLKFNLEGSLNFERTPLKLQRPIKLKNNNGERRLGGGGGEGEREIKAVCFFGQKFQ
jgi:hypothetical protein